jgi:D-glycero-D-manno-heptose 1,7-bisphosphate phosphatase
MKLAILDRDGVINEEPDEDIRSPTDWKPVRGSLEAIARLNHAGWRVVVAMNRPVHSGQDIELLTRINGIMQRRIRESGGMIEAVFFCPHPVTAHCNCHKPGPGLLLDVASRLRIRLDQVPFIGDALHDMQTATAAGARPILVKTGKGFGTVSMPEFDPAIPVYDDLYGAVEALLARPEA